MDADDVSLPERFAIQTAFLDENPQVSICTTTVTMINEKGDKLNRRDWSRFIPIYCFTVIFIIQL